MYYVYKQFFKKQRELVYSFQKKTFQVIIWILWSLALYSWPVTEQKLFCLNMCYCWYLNLLSIACHLINYSLPQECLWLNEKITILTLPLDLQSLGFGHGPSITALAFDSEFLLCTSFSEHGILCVIWLVPWTQYGFTFLRCLV